MLPSSTWQRRVSSILSPTQLSAAGAISFTSLPHNASLLIMTNNCGGTHFYIDLRIAKTIIFKLVLMTQVAPPCEYRVDLLEAINNNLFAWIFGF